MSEQEPKGTMGHVKGMASSVHLHTSGRGNTYPRLLISVDYRDPKHIRLRAYDEQGKVVDTLGANDIAEVALLAGMTVRYGETMFARKLRRASEGLPSRGREEAEATEEASRTLR